MLRDDFFAAEYGPQYLVEYAVRIAETREDRVVAHRIRHEVYCEELRFEGKTPHRLEVDDYDSSSVSVLLSEQQKSGGVGCVRLVVPDYAREHHLPMSRFSEKTSASQVLADLKMGNVPHVELSRLCVLPSYRGKWGKQDLLLGAFGLAWQQGVDAIVAVADPRFAFYLRHQRIDFQQIGDPVEKNGTRLPILIETQKNYDRWAELVSEAHGRTDFSEVISGHVSSLQPSALSVLREKKLALG